MAEKDAEPQPPSYPVNLVKLNAPTDSTISNVNLYSRRAEVTRTFKFKLTSGQNKVIILGLPDSFNDDTLRVEGRGDATIHDVSIGFEPPPASAPPATPQSQQKLNELYSQRDQLDRALDRYERTLKGLNDYLRSLTIQHVDAETLVQTIESVDTASKKYEDKIAEAKQDLRRVGDEMREEKMVLNGAGKDKAESRHQLRKMATVNVFAEVEGEIEMVVTYGVENASWTALYEVRAKTDSKEAPVEISYKAAIAQSTGEEWANAPMTLQTATPTFGIGLPKLEPWNLSIKPQPVSTYSTYGVKGVSHSPAIIQIPMQMQPTMTQMPMQPPIIIARRSRSFSRSRSRSPRRDRDREPRSRSRRHSPSTYRGRHRSSSPSIFSRRSRSRSPFRIVQSMPIENSGVNASFKVPGLISIPLANPITSTDGRVLHKVLVPKITSILISPHHCNRDPALWGPDAAEWKPERWLSPLPESLVEARVPGVYSHLMTFLGGSRSCIGFKFAQLEMKVVLSLLVERFQFALGDKEIIWLSNGIVQPSTEDAPVTSGRKKTQIPLVVSLAA